MDLYEILGVPRSATLDQIKDAYRNQAKSLHPDMPGGNREKFEALQTTYAILNDADKRAHYDRTGELPDMTPDNAHAPVYGCLSAALNAVTAGVLRKGCDIEKTDMIAALRQYLEADIEMRAKALAEVEEPRARWAALRERFSAKDDGVNVMASIIGNQIMQIDRMGEHHRQDVAVVTAALEIVDRHEFRFDQEIVRQTFAFQTFAGTASTSAFG